MAPSIDETFLPKEVNAEVGKEFKIVIPFKGGPIKSAHFTNVGIPMLSLSDKVH